MTPSHREKQTIPRGKWLTQAHTPEKAQLKSRLLDCTHPGEQMRLEERPDHSTGALGSRGRRHSSRGGEGVTWLKLHPNPSERGVGNDLECKTCFTDRITQPNWQAWVCVHVCKRGLVIADSNCLLTVNSLNYDQVFKISTLGLERRFSSSCSSRDLG